MDALDIMVGLIKGLGANVLGNVDGQILAYGPCSVCHLHHPLSYQVTYYTAFMMDNTDN